MEMSLKMYIQQAKMGMLLTIYIQQAKHGDVAYNLYTAGKTWGCCLKFIYGKTLAGCLEIEISY